MQKNKKIYETTFIVNASLDDPIIDAIIGKVQEQIIRYGGEIISTNKWGRKRLAYSIKKKNNGFYTVIEFQAYGTTIQQLEKFYKLDENILRYLTILLDKKALQAKREIPPAAPEIEEIPELFEPEEHESLFEDADEN